MITLTLKFLVKQCLKNRSIFYFHQNHKHFLLVLQLSAPSISIATSNAFYVEVFSFVMEIESICITIVIGFFFALAAIRNAFYFCRDCQLFVF